MNKAVELLEKLASLQNDAPLEKYRKEWEDVMKEVWDFIHDYNLNKVVIKPQFDYTKEVCTGNCKFPSVWHGIIPPSCETCGKNAEMINITC